MNRVELEGVLAHELSHIKNYDILVSTLAVTLVGAVALLTDIAIRMMWWNGGRISRDGDRDDGFNPLVIVGFVLLIVGPIIARVMQATISRRRETLADVSACQLTRYPPGLISALEKLRDDTTVTHSASTATAHLWIEQPMSRCRRRGTARVVPQAVRHAPAARRADQPAERAMTPTPNATRSSRRGARRLLAVTLVAGLVAVAACGDDDDAAQTTAATDHAGHDEPSRPRRPEHDDGRRRRPRRPARPRPRPRPRRPRRRSSGCRSPACRWPTGETAPDRPALVVKIDNVECAHRTQQGLNNADIVFEEIVEGRLTRFAAVFHSQESNPVGPIRSGRSQDVDLLGAFQRPLMVVERRQPRRRASTSASPTSSTCRRRTTARATSGPATARRRTTSGTTPSRCGRPTPPEAGRPIQIFRTCAGRRRPGGRRRRPSTARSA